MKYSIEDIAQISGGQAWILFPKIIVETIATDHREARNSTFLFAAIKGARHDGHTFIPELLEQGVRNFLVSDPQAASQYRAQANILLVQDVLEGLQKLAAHYRSQFDLPVVAITGSNGKTIVKEWVNDLLHTRYNVCRSPKSFNSQLGVPLSVFPLEQLHTLGVFEAGISKPGEMKNLAEIIQPTLGVFTNLGDAHAAHFASDREKFEEKWCLFEGAKTVVCSCDQPWFSWIPREDKSKLLTWSFQDPSADVYVKQVRVKGSETSLHIEHNSKAFHIQLPFTDKASMENAMSCFGLLATLNCLDADDLKQFEALQAVAMRMEVKPGIEQSMIIDDSYNADLESLHAALEQLKSLPNKGKMVILSGLSENLEDQEIYPRIARMLNDVGITELIGIGQEIADHQSHFKVANARFYRDADQFWKESLPSDFRQKAILVKGARKYKLETIGRRLQQQKHETVLEIDLHKMLENLRYFRAMLKPETKIMVMVKAFAYGSGGYEVASFLQNQQVDYLAVAYADEGVALRQRGVRLPIMVMSPSQASHEVMLQHELEPEIYSFRSLEHFITAARGYRHFASEFTIHIKFDTGMHRLGFTDQDIPALLEVLAEHPWMKVGSMFTHLSASDNPSEDGFTRSQFARFEALADTLEKGLPNKPLRHALNSTGILRFPEAHYDMVRLGIGLYGFSGSEDDKYLSALGNFKTYIAQIRAVPAGESVGYNRKGIDDRTRQIATIAVGYADGLDRQLGNGNWSVKWQDQECMIVGDICMDMCMIDVTGIQAQEGDEVVVFGSAEDIRLMAEKLGTIAYEVLTKISPRVRRLYLQE